MVRHLVFFGLDASLLPQDPSAHLQQIKKALEQLPNEIPSLISMEVFPNQNPNESVGFILQAEVEDYQGLQEYAQHPAHVAIVKQLIAPYKTMRGCVDYTL